MQKKKKQNKKKQKKTGKNLGAGSVLKYMNLTIRLSCNFVCRLSSISEHKDMIHCSCVVSSYTNNTHTLI